MNNLTVFNFQGQEVRFVGTTNKPEWLAHDVCTILGIQNVSDTIKRLDNYQKGIAIIYTLGGPQKMATVTEPGLYSLIFTSRKSIAKKFQQWVFEEVLPSIRKTGQYSTPQFKESTNSLSIDDIEHRIRMAESCVAIAERFNIPDSKIKTLVSQLICELPSEPQSKSSSLDMIYTKILKKATPEGITPAKLQQSIRELKTVGADVVKSYLVELAEMGYGKIKEEGRSFIFFLNEAKINN